MFIKVFSCRKTLILNEGRKLVGMDEKIWLELSLAEAIVLESLLARCKKGQSLKFIDQSEQVVLWTIEAILEVELDELLDPNYLEILSKAQEYVRNNN